VWPHYSLAQSDLLNEVHHVLQLNGAGGDRLPGTQPGALQEDRVLDTTHGAQVGVVTTTKTDPDVTRTQAAVPAAKPQSDTWFQIGTAYTTHVHSLGSIGTA
jgi:hypothetical protein